MILLEVMHVLLGNKIFFSFARKNFIIFEFSICLFDKYWEKRQGYMAAWLRF